jgi:hypothetical protein
MDQGCISAFKVGRSMLTRAESSTAGAMLSRRDINECSVVGGDVCVVQSGVAATRLAVNG